MRRRRLSHRENANIPRNLRTTSSPHCSYPCTMTSVSVWERNLCPSATSCARNSAKLYISPLNVIQTDSSSLHMGWCPAEDRSIMESLRCCKLTHSESSGTTKYFSPPSSGPRWRSSSPHFSSAGELPICPKIPHIKLRSSLST